MANERWFEIIVKETEPDKNTGGASLDACKILGWLTRKYGALLRVHIDEPFCDRENEWPIGFTEITFIANLSTREVKELAELRDGKTSENESE